MLADSLLKLVRAAYPLSSDMFRGPVLSIATSRRRGGGGLVGLPLREIDLKNKLIRLMRLYMKSSSKLIGFPERFIL